MRATHEALGLGILAICINIVLMLVKIGVGLLGHSYALVADGIESAGDIFASLITWAAFQFSLKPADEDHPFGHGKAEALATMFSGLCLFAAAGVIGWHAIQEIRTPHHAPAWFTLPVLIGAAVAKEMLSRKVMRTGADLGSAALKGDAWHHRADAVTSGAAAVGIAIALIGGKGYEAADDWAALAACLFIVWNGFMIWKGGLHDALDGSVPPDLHASVVSVAAATQGVDNTEKCRIRKSGIHLFVEIHVRVDPDITVRDGHDISHRVKDRLLEEHLTIKDVVVHIEPSRDIRR